MKKLSFLLSALFIALTSVFAVDVAKIGETNYETLQAAVDAVDAGQEIVLLDDLELNQAVNLNKDIAYTINLGENILEYKNASSGNYLLELSKGDVTIKNGYIVSDKRAANVTGGKLTLEGDVIIETTNRVLGIYNDGYVVVKEGCDMSISSTDDWGIVIIGSTSAVTGNPRLDFAGKLVVKGESMAISGNGNDKNNPVINILEGAVITSEGVAIYQPSNTTLTISGGTITGSTAVYVKCGSVSVTGGKLVGNGAAADYSYNGNGCNPTGDALVIDNCNYPQGVASVSVTGGEFESENASAVSSYVGNNVDESEKVVDFIEGGTFVSAENHEVAPALLAEGVEMKEDPQNPGSYIVKEIVPVISVNPDKWETEVIMTGNKVDLVSDEFTVTVTNPNGSVTTYTIAGGPESAFGWNSAMKASFHATAGGVYKDTLVVSYPGAENVRIPLQVTVNVPVITVSANSLDFGEIELAEATAGKTDKTIEVSVTGGVTVTPEVTGTDADKFAAEIKDGKLEVTLTASAAGSYSATITLSAPNAESKTVAVSATVKEAAGTTTCAAYEYTFTAKMDKSAKLGDYNWTLTTPTSSFNYDTQATARGAQFGSSSSPAGSVSLVTANVAECLLNDITVNASIAKDGDAKLAVYINGTQVGATKDLTTTATDYTFFNTASLQGNLEIKLTNTTKAMYIKSIKTNTETPVAVTGVTLDKTTASIAVGKKVILTPTVAPADASNKEVTWSSNKESIATVDENGKVTGVAVGEAVITVKTKDGNFTATCTVTVTEPVASDAFKLIKDAANLSVGAEIIIVSTSKNLAAGELSSEYLTQESVTIEDEEITLADGSKVSVWTLGGESGAWTLADENGKLLGATAVKKLALNSGKNKWDITIAANGDATIQNEEESYGRFLHNAGTGGRFTTYASSTSTSISMLLPQIYARGGTPVVPVATTTLSVSPKATEVEEGKTVTLTVERNGNDELTWGSKDEAIATVSNKGVVTGVKAGVVKIWAVANNISDTCVVTVKEATVPPTPPTPTIPSTFVKVTEEPTDWSGQYFVVYEDSEDATLGLIFKGEDIANGYVEGTIEDEKIDASGIDNYENYVITIAPMTGGYSLKIGDKYIGGKSGSNTIDFKADAILNTIELDENGDALITSNSTYFTFNATSGQMRFRYYKSLTQQPVALYKAEEPKATTTLSVQETAEVAVGKTVTLNVTRDGNDKLTWKSMDETVATVANGVVTGVKEGEVKIAVSVGNLSDTCTVTVVAGETPVEPGDLEEKTIAEFIEAKGMECLLTGVVSNIKTDKDGSYNVYGNFDLTDESGTIYVYGLLTAEGEAKQFQSLGVDEGDTLTVIAKEYLLYTNKNDGSTKDEVVDAIFVSVKKAQGGTTPVEPGEELNVDFAQAYTFTYEGTTYWAFDAYDYENNYPELYFDFEATDLTHLNGTHEIDYSGLWTSEKDSIEFVSGTVTITCTASATDEDYATYHVNAAFVDEDGKEYAYSFDVKVVAYDGDNSTEDNIIYIELEDIPSDEPGDQAIDNTVVIDANAPVYNIQGMQVNRNTRGILIQNGQKFILLQ